MFLQVVKRQIIKLFG